jgi:hypothetical protein
MKIIYAGNTTHVITLIPRYYATGSVIVELENQTTRAKGNVTNSYTITDGIMTVTFEMVVKNKDNFYFTLSKDGKTIYKGQIIVKDEQ